MTGPASNTPVVAVDDVSKVFRIPHERVSTLKERALHPFRRSTHERFEALRGVSFAVERGEFFGIVGRNGSGKSTLLKCMAGIYRADSGAIYVNGRISTFIELGVGFNPELAARDNVLINGVMLGLSPREARERYDRVMDFAELREFEDLKLKNYSSGMQVRLAFSVLVQVDADILLIDEVLAVGDVSFQQKCFDVFNRLRDEGKTILFVTHDMAAVRRFCHRAVLLERGRVVHIGKPSEVAASYVDLSFGEGDGSAVQREDGRSGDGSAEILEAWWEDESGERQGMLHQGRPCSFHARVRFTNDVHNPAIAALFGNERHEPLMATSTDWKENGTGSFRAGEEVEFSVRMDMAFAPGRVFATPWVVHGGHRVMDRRPEFSSVVVAGSHVSGGLVDLPHDVRLEAGERSFQSQGGAV
ncbi:MAG TPA: ABC transporter ATP-binding protein [Thermoleophilaceae bacterium]|nr:ABC transporter ATP-binding protein [Thermoleophilaceae bacterium]